MAIEFTVKLPPAYLSAKSRPTPCLA